jgi:hypothetical protein
MSISGEAGNVGIGTTSPGRLLTVSNAGTANQILLADTTGATNQHYGSIGFAAGKMSFNGARDSDFATVMWQVVIDYTGNFGIGTTTPGNNKLNVYQADSTSNGVLINMNHFNSNAAGLSIIKGGTDGKYISAGNFVVDGL